MEPTTEPDPYSDAALLRTTAAENATLRELLTAVAQELERLACSHPEHATPFRARAMRMRRRLWEAR
jgi:hypothetical protein